MPVSNAAASDFLGSPAQRARPGSQSDVRHLSDFEITVEYPAFHQRLPFDGLSTQPDGSQPDISLRDIGRAEPFSGELMDLLDDGPTVAEEPSRNVPREVRSDGPTLAETDDGPAEPAAAAVHRAPAPTDDGPTEIEQARPAEMPDAYSPPSFSLVADADAILAAYRDGDQPMTWAQRIALQVASLPAPKNGPEKAPAARRLLRSVVGFADRLGGAVVDGGVSLYRWLRSSALARRISARKCKACGQCRKQVALDFGLAPRGPEQVAHFATEKAWEFFRCLPDECYPNARVRMVIRRCESCAKHSTAEVLWQQGPWRRLVARDIELEGDEVYYLLSLRPAPPFGSR